MDISEAMREHAKRMIKILNEERTKEIMENIELKKRQDKYKEIHRI